jgi:hypothetical protein
LVEALGCAAEVVDREGLGSDFFMRPACTCFAFYFEGTDVVFVEKDTRGLRLGVVVGRLLEIVREAWLMEGCMKRLSRLAFE